MAVPVSFNSWTYADNTVKSNGEPEFSVVELPIITLSAANLVATSGLVDNLTAAIEALVLGNLLKTNLVAERSLLSGSAAALQAAQRENKLLLRYIGSVTSQKFRASLPTFDLTKLPNHSEFVDLTADVGLALKTAFEAVVRSPNDATETVVLSSAQFVGRNT